MEKMCLEPCMAGTMLRSSPSSYCHLGAEVLMALSRQVDGHGMHIDIPAEKALESRECGIPFLYL
jgi:hypothetical protein